MDEAQNTQNTPQQRDVESDREANRDAQQQADEAGSNAKTIAILGYIVPILFFLPSVMEDLKNNEFAKFHANQQLALLVYWAIVWVIGLIPILGWIIAFFASLLGVAIVLIGIVNVSNGHKKKLPLIGGMSLLN
ncbi:hypothetical protein BRC21_01565 [Candidatus Saccharibacteria bacterium SW_7_54_9]|nr:MAG: hypothetical protein BRC21_01565 [Candidatus Saccharibacteria bacterium SW_7_54_9]